MTWRSRVGGALAALVLAGAGCGDSAEPTRVDTAPPVASSTVAPPATTAPPTSGEPTTTAVAPPTTTTPETTTTVEAAPPGWRQVATVGDGPGRRRNAVLAVDGAGGVVYVHGGREGATSLDELWRLDLDTGAWELLAGDGPTPAPRFSHTGIWDEARRRLVIFSGQGEGFGDFFSDVWAYDPTTGGWSELAANNAGPADRYGSCAGYDRAGDRFLISHGFTDSGRFDDTWAFSLADDSWTQITAAGPVPGARCLHVCSYEATTGSLLLFGGQSDEAAFLGDTWVLDGTGWREVTGDAPSARKFPAAAPLGSVVLLSGGDSADGIVDDSWTFDPATDAWTTAGPGPGARESAASAADADSGSVYLFGGRGPDGERNDLWVFGGSG